MTSPPQPQVGDILCCRSSGDIGTLASYVHSNTDGGHFYILWISGTPPHEDFVTYEQESDVLRLLHRDAWYLIEKEFL